MRNFASAVSARLLVLLSIMVVAGAGAGIMWFGKLKEEGVIGKEVDREAVVRDYNEVPGVMLVSSSFNWNSQMGDGMLGYLYVKLSNQSRFEVKGVKLEMSIYKLGANEPVHTSSTMFRSFTDEWTLFAPTMLPGALSQAFGSFTVPSEAVSALDNSGRREIRITQVELYENPKDMSVPGHLFTFLANRDFAGYKAAVDANPSLISLSDESGVTAAHIAAAWDDVAALDYIGSHGGNLNAKTGRSVVPIHIAAQCASPAAIRYLAAKRISINEGDGSKQTPIIYAASDGRPEAVDALIQLGANVNDTDATGLSALHLVCARGQIDTARLLLNAGAKVNTEASDGETPLLRAVISGNIDLVKLLLSEGAELKSADSDGNGALHYAASGYSEEMVQYVSTLKVDKKARNKDGQSAGDIAALRQVPGWRKYLD